MSGTERLVDELARHGVGSARVAVVLGSGLGAFAERVEGARAIPYEALSGMPRASVPGHAGRLVLGEVGGVPVVVQQGRVHLYEGASPEEVTRAVRAFAHLGVEAVVLTNAAGGLRAEWELPALMRITDHVNLQPMRWRNFVFETGTTERSNVAHRRLQVPSTSDRKGRRQGSDDGATPYDVELGRALEKAAREVGVALVHGIYAGLLGPSYETPAEIRMLRRFGVDAVGMSTVAEVAAARGAGLRVAAVSCITNPAAGVAEGPLSHEEVVAAGARASADFCDLLGAALPHVAAALG